MKLFTCSLLLLAGICLLPSCKKTEINTSCGTATGLTYDSLTYTSATLKWNAVNGAISYTVQYRQVGTTNWSSNVVTVDTIGVSGLTASTIYEFQVQTICTTGLSAFTASSIFKTDSTPPPPTYYIYATYRGQVHTFATIYGMGGTSQGDLTSVGATEAGTNNTIGLTQTYLTSSTSVFACDPNQLPNKLGLTIGGVTYQNNINSAGSETRVIGNGTATVTFNGTIYNTNNASDSIVVTNGSYSGLYTVH